ncbi:MAG TPA: hypothetical protein VHB79_30995 [Polyangiaceae bacterium]|nr:hypothetical protein [Polyangiaceae bacterium]
MHISCPKGCTRRAWRIAPHVLAIEPAGLMRRGSASRATRIATPHGIGDAYAQMVSKVRHLGTAPALEVYDDLHGVGGLFIPDNWVIAVGLKDIADISDRILSTRHDDVAAIARDLARTKGPRVDDLRGLLIVSGMVRCVGHELGHALIHRGWVNPFSPDGEAGADYYAGQIDAARGTDWRLGEMFFRAIGCRGPTCSHPSPENRSTAYMTGYENMRFRAA